MKRSLKQINEDNRLMVLARLQRMSEKLISHTIKHIQEDLPYYRHDRELMLEMIEDVRRCMDTLEGR